MIPILFPGRFVSMAFVYGVWLASISVSQANEEKRPIALALSDDHSHLFVGNSGDGTLSVINTNTFSIEAEYPVAEVIGGIEFRSKSQQLFITDFQKHQLVSATLDSGKLDRKWQVGVCCYPRSVRLSPNQTQIAIAGYWSRQVEILSGDGDWSTEPGGRRVIDLNFVPGFLCWLDEGTLLVADAFGSRLDTVDSPTGKVISQKSLIDRRIGGLALSPTGETVIITAQLLNPLARSDRNDIHWGLMISNQLLSVEAKRFRDPSDTLERINRQQPFGGPGEGKADPAAICVLSSDKVIVCLEGVDELAIGNLADLGFGYVGVAARPVAVVADPSRHLAYVACLLDNVVSVVDTESYKVVATTKLGETSTESLEKQGERVFYSSRLSHDGWLSCNSCHVNGHTSELLNDNFSDGTFGSPKRILSLLGCRDTAPYAWNGGRDDLDSQTAKSIESTMQSDQPADPTQVAAISAYLRTLVPPPALSAARKIDQAQVAEDGRRLFIALRCNQCHSNETYTSNQVFDVGLVDESKSDRFNPPSLIGLSQRSVFFHDNRCDSLEQLVDEFRHQLPRELETRERAALLAFLRSL